MTKSSRDLNNYQNEYKPSLSNPPKFNNNRLQSARVHQNSLMHKKMTRPMTGRVHIARIIPEQDESTVINEKIEDRDTLIK